MFRNEFPFKAIDLQLLAPPLVNGVLTKDSETRLEDIETLLEKNSSWAFYPKSDVRSHVLKQLHEETLRIFVSSPGFGQGRLMVRPNRYFLNYRLRKGPPIDQSHSRTQSA